MTRSFAVALALALPALGVLLTGCASSSNAPTSPSTAVTSTAPTTPPVSPSSDATPLPPTTAPSTTTPRTPPTTSAAPITTAPVTSPAPTTTVPPAPPAPRSTCTDVTVRVITGSGTTGREFAALQFTNAASTACDLRGYPVARLLLDGRFIGPVSTPAGSATSSRHLQPGDTAESQLNDYVMNCQASLSDAISVQVPGSDTVVTRQGTVLRACPLRVGPLGAPE